MRWLGLIAVVAGIAATAAIPAGAADECQGLQVCLPVHGPWVAVPAVGAVDYELRCPLPRYVVAGLDARLADAEIDVAFRGEVGAPVGPGVTTRSAALFTAMSTAAVRRPTSFRPFVGCIPASGGGGRSQTAFLATPPGGRRPTFPLMRAVVGRRVGEGRSVVAARCPRGSRLLGGSHAVAFRTKEPPSPRLLAAVSVQRSVSAGAVVARVTVAAGVLSGARAEIQLHAICRRGAP